MLNYQRVFWEFLRKEITLGFVLGYWVYRVYPKPAIEVPNIDDRPPRNCARQGCVLVWILQLLYLNDKD